MKRHVRNRIEQLEQVVVADVAPDSPAANQIPMGDCYPVDQSETGRASIRGRCEVSQQKHPRAAQSEGRRAAQSEGRQR